MSHQMAHLCYVVWHQRTSLPPASVKAGEETSLAETPISMADNQKQTKQQSSKVTLPSCSQFHENISSKHIIQVSQWRQRLLDEVNMNDAVCFSTNQTSGRFNNKDSQITHAIFLFRWTDAESSDS